MLQYIIYQTWCFYRVILYIFIEFFILLLLLGTTICFTLVSNITGRRPVDIITKKSNLYEMEPFPLQIRNPFNKDATFAIKLQVRFTTFTFVMYVLSSVLLCVLIWFFACFRRA
jgi:hypothetical protein